MTAEKLSTRAVADALSISESTVRRWCNEGKLHSIKTAGGHRKIPLSAVLQLARETGRNLDESTLLGQRLLTSKRTPGEISAHLADCLCEGREQSTVTTITSAFSDGHSLADLGDQLVGPAMAEVGRRWEIGQINVAHERRACHLAMLGLNEVERLLPPANDSAPVALGATPGADHSQIGTKLVELLLRSMGWRTRQLGAGVPLLDIAATFQSAKHELLWLSVIHLVDAAEFVAEYQKHIDPLVLQLSQVAVGGRALDSHVRSRIRYSFFGSSLGDLQTYVRGMPVSPTAIVNLSTGNTATFGVSNPTNC